MFVYGCHCAIFDIIRSMKILQKIEFWLFSVPALVVAMGAIAHYGAWRALWVFPVGYTLSSVTQFSKGMVYEVLDAPGTNPRQ